MSFRSWGSNDPDGSIVSYLWDFGDGATSTNRNPDYLYSNAGTYTVTLMVTDDDGYTDIDTTTSTISTLPDPVPPIAEVNGAYTGTEDESINFSSSGSYDSDGTIVNYLWKALRSPPVR